MKETIIFDCDDVLCDTASTLKTGIEEVLNRKIIPINQWDTWHLEDLFPDLCWDILREWIIDNNILSILPINDKSVNVVDQIKRLGYNTTILTARDYVPDAYQITKKWIKHNQLPIDDLICIPPSINKADIISTLPYPVKLFVDDHHDHIIRCERKNIVELPVLKTQPWNLRAPVNYRIDCLEEILSLI